MNGIQFLVFIASIAAAPVMLNRARVHDRHLEQREHVDHDALEEEANTRLEDDADAARKGE